MKVNDILCICAASALTLMSLSACGEGVNYDMTDAARASMDRLVGVYVLEGADWDGGSIDLDGDGVASESIYEELMKIPEVKEETCVRIDMREDYEAYARINVAIEDIYVHNGVSEGLWSVRCFTPTFGVGTSGEYELDIDPNYGILDGISSWETSLFARMTVEVTGDESLSLSADTALLDRCTSQIVSGRLTYRFKCVSGKGR